MECHKGLITAHLISFDRVGVFRSVFLRRCGNSICSKIVGKHYQAPQRHPPTLLRINRQQKNLWQWSLVIVSSDIYSQWHHTWWFISSQSLASPRQGSYFNPVTCTKNYPDGLAVVWTPSCGRLAKILRSIGPQLLVWIWLKVHDCTNVKTGSGLSVLRGCQEHVSKGLCCAIEWSQMPKAI